MSRHSIPGTTVEGSKTKVLLIAGTDRSGTTMLHNVLGQIDGFFSSGELRGIWERSFIINKLCGCGVPFQECELWRSVICEAFGSADQVDANEMWRFISSLHVYHLPFTLLPHMRQRYASQFSGYLNTLEKLYKAIQVTTSCKVIVDSSKIPAYGYILRMIPAIDLYVLHVIRDSRAVAYSWLRKKLFETSATGPEYMPQINPMRSALQWNTRSAATEIWLRPTSERYMMLRYETFVDKPQESVERIVDFLGETTERLPFVTEHAVELKANHSVFGNMVRFQTGTVELKLDEEWKLKMKGLHKATVTALTWPLLLKYGYLKKFDKQHSVEPT